MASTAVVFPASEAPAVRYRVDWRADAEPVLCKDCSSIGCCCLERLDINCKYCFPRPIKLRDLTAASLHTHIPGDHAHPRRSHTLQAITHTPGDQPHSSWSPTSQAITHIPGDHTHSRRSRTLQAITHIPGDHAHPRRSRTLQAITHIQVITHIPGDHAHPGDQPHSSWSPTSQAITHIQVVVVTPGRTRLRPPPACLPGTALDPAWKRLLEFSHRLSIKPAGPALKDGGTNNMENSGPPLSSHLS
ncbi:hypothetical protein D623_10023644 [Myotis brandtii]|uniref:Uncharacterized protein n=1 Tax=Myotis brandtii TaxID=109478 RepID=S7N727_MYOBR|nr:hypothetical protein D623_10023644 [Myotis brandtii]